MHLASFEKRVAKSEVSKDTGETKIDFSVFLLCNRVGTFSKISQHAIKTGFEKNLSYVIQHILMQEYAAEQNLWTVIHAEGETFESHASMP